MKTLWRQNQENSSDRISHAWAPLNLVIVFYLSNVEEKKRLKKLQIASWSCPISCVCIFCHTWCLFSTIKKLQDRNAGGCSSWSAQRWAHPRSGSAARSKRRRGQKAEAGCRRLTGGLSKLVSRLLYPQDWRWMSVYSPCYACVPGSHI